MCVWRSIVLGILPGRYSDIDLSRFKSLVNDTLIQQTTLKFVTREATATRPKNRQNSIEVPSDDPINYLWESYQETIIERCKTAYDWAIEAGIAKEQARAVLPEGLTMSRMYVNGTLRSWIHYIELRASHGTQQEHIDIAKACGQVIDTYSTPFITK